MVFSLNFDQRLRQTLANTAPHCEWVTGWRPAGDNRSKVDVAGLQDSYRACSWKSS